MEELRGKDWYTMHKTASREFLHSRGRCQVPTWNRNVFGGGGSTAKAYQPQGFTRLLPNVATCCECAWLAREQRQEFFCR